MSLRKTPRRGFSLVELIVSISVIAVLIGIIIPVLPRVIDSSRRVACSANLRSIGQGVEMFKGEHKDKFPEARYMAPPWLSGDQRPAFNVAIADYIDFDSEVYKCPGDSVVHGLEYTTDTDERATCLMSYTYISELSGDTFENSFFATFLRRLPTETPVMHDFDGGTFETQDGRMIPVDFFHARRNVLFVDGHVAASGS